MGEEREACRHCAGIEAWGCPHTLPLSPRRLHFPAPPCTHSPAGGPITACDTRICSRKPLSPAGSWPSCGEVPAACGGYHVQQCWALRLESSLLSSAPISHSTLTGDSRPGAPRPWSVGACTAPSAGRGRAGVEDKGTGQRSTEELAAHTPCPQCRDFGTGVGVQI